MKTVIVLTALAAFCVDAHADDVVARSVRRGDTVVTTTARGVYTTQIQRNGSGHTSETRFQSHTPQGFAARNVYRPMTH